MPDKNGKRDTQRTDEGYEIPVPKRKDVFDALDKAAKKLPKSQPRRSRDRKRGGA
jgi:hypothetical protein